MKYAVLSMDIEDWHHLEYFNGMSCDKGYSLLDGIGVYQDILAKYNVPSSFFVLGELIDKMGSLINELDSQDHELGVHGWNHDRPMTVKTQLFAEMITRAKNRMETALGKTVLGYRAPCFSLDRERLDIVRDIGFEYDSSRMPFQEHPLYGSLDIDDFSQVTPNIFRLNSFFEFQLSTLSIAGKNIPVSGGGYMRMFPWVITKALINSYLKKNELYICYIHPFELSRQKNPPLPKELGRVSQIRFGLGRTSVPEKLGKLIELLKQKGFSFQTFSGLRETLLDNQPDETKC